MIEFIKKRVFIFSLALVFIFANLVTVLTPMLASAISVYDNNYRKTDKVILSNDGWNPYYGACPIVDYSANWVAAMTTALGNNAYNSDNVQAVSYLTSWQTALQNGRWSVSQSTKDSGEGHMFKEIYIAWTEDNSLALDWTSAVGHVNVTGNDIHTVSLRTKVMVNSSGSDCTPYAMVPSYTTTISNATSQIPSDNRSIENLFVYSDHLNLPADYEGPVIPSSFAPGVHIYPKVGYTIDGKDIKALSYTDKSALPIQMKQYGLTWQLQRKQADNSYQTIDEQSYTDMARPYHYVVPERDNYRLVVSFYNPPPLAPPPSNYILHSAVLPFKLDGSVFSSSTDLAVCTDQGQCTEPSPYEDCSTYGTDLIGGLGCVMRNFGVWLKSALVTLFVPSDSYFSDYFDKMRTLFSDKLGFLFWPVTFLSNLFPAFMVNDNAGVSSLSFTATSGIIPAFSIDFAAIKDHWPSLWAYIQLSLSGITVFGLVVALYHKYMRIIKA